MISIGSDYLSTLSSLTDELSDTAQNSATVTGRLLSEDRATTLATFSLSYVSSSDGTYQGTIPAATTATLVEGTLYIIQATAVSSGVIKVIERKEVAGYEQSD